MEASPEIVDLNNNGAFFAKQWKVRFRGKGISKLD
jgi:hypothetical protein